MKKSIHSLTILTTLLYASGCSKDFKLFEDYIATTIVYGLVDIEYSNTYLVSASDHCRIKN